ncbi:hypothetical protein EVAR_21115_1 [Eumeta japonica]|uniref:Uncharacterized protein n=1 Tax=Eumeta variegata TaxID=151549 RepID=A0A4C1VTR8_EUMVA|nr:hypothetical protein EVAR_21115_1 [Eumeta japonica]
MRARYDAGDERSRRHIRVNGRRPTSHRYTLARGRGVISSNGRGLLYATLSVAFAFHSDPDTVPGFNPDRALDCPTLGFDPDSILHFSPGSDKGIE